ncbi:hypothetical protein YPPY14_3391, partial [Yersinia pestis PY-14]
MLNGSSTS